MVADGLGHGPEAAKASEEAVRLFRRHQDDAPSTILSAVHAGLRHTRGGAVSVARYDREAERLTFAGIGNVAGAVVGNGETKRTVSLAGTAGHAARRIQEFEHPMRADGLFPPVLGRDRLRVLHRRLPGLGRSASEPRGGRGLPRLRPGPRRRHGARGSRMRRMRWPLLTTLVEHEDDIATVRHRLRTMAERLGFNLHDQTRIATAVSEIARNAYCYAAGGRIEYGLDGDGAGQCLMIRVVDRGPGIAPYRRRPGRPLPLAHGARHRHHRLPPPDGPVRHRDRGRRGHGRHVREAVAVRFPRPSRGAILPTSPRPSPAPGRRSRRSSCAIRTVSSCRASRNSQNARKRPSA